MGAAFFTGMGAAFFTGMGAPFFGLIMIKPSFCRELQYRQHV
jgi:hypothetical protein